MGTISRVLYETSCLGKRVIERGKVSVPVLETWSGRKVSADRLNRGTWNLPIARYFQWGEESHVKLATPDGSLQLVLHAEGSNEYVKVALHMGGNEKITVTVNPDTPKVAQKIVGVFMHEAVVADSIRLTDDLLFFMEVLQQYLPELLTHAVEPLT